MAKLGRYTASSPRGIPGAGGRPATAGDFGGLTAGALGNVGAAAGDLTARLQQVAEARENVKAFAHITDLRERVLERLAAAQSEGVPLGDALVEELEAAAVEAEGEFTTVAGRDRLRALASAVVLEARGSSIKHDANLVGAEARNAAAEFQRVSGVRLQGDPSQLDSVLAEQNLFVSGLGLPKQEAEGLRRELRVSAGKAAAQGLIKVDPGLAEEELNGGAFDDVLSADLRNQLIGQAGTAVRQLREEARFERLERERQRAETRNRVLTQAYTDLFAAEERLTTPGIVALSLQEFEDGTRVLSANDVEGLFRLRKQVAEEGVVRTDPRAAVEVLSSLDTIGEDRVIELFSQGRLAQGDFERWLEVSRTGDTPLRSVRGTAFRSAASFMGVSPAIAELSPEFGRASTRLQALAFEREEEIRAQGGNPVDYYTGEGPGTFRSDAATIGREYDLVSGPQAAAGEMRSILDSAEKGVPVLDGLVYLGGERFLPDGSLNPEAWTRRAGAGSVESRPRQRPLTGSGSGFSPFRGGAVPITEEGGED